MTKPLLAWFVKIAPSPGLAPPPGLEFENYSVSVPVSYSEPVLEPEFLEPMKAPVPSDLSVEILEEFLDKNGIVVPITVEKYLAIMIAESQILATKKFLEKYPDDSERKKIIAEGIKVSD